MIREVLQQALEVLTFAKDGNAAWTFLLPEAIAAIKSVLVQPDREPVCPECTAVVLYECVACSNTHIPAPASDG